MDSALPNILNLRHKSLSRGNLLVLTSFGAAILLSDFPHNHPTLYLIIPTLVALIGTGETARCMRRRWNWYHAGVVLCIYMDLMAVCMILFFLLYPYAHFLGSMR
jgi:hypothetical protein